VLNGATEFPVNESSSFLKNLATALSLRLWRHLVVIGWAAMLATIVGCAANRGAETSSSPPPPRLSAGVAPSGQSGGGNSGGRTVDDYTGVWQGTTLASCSIDLPLQSRCNAQQNVTITLLQGQDSKFSGKYQCSYGNMDCYHSNDTGKVIAVSMAGRRVTIRVLMPDGTSCIFTGRYVNETINGGYTCYQGGARLEQGEWRARRSY
jgi:hypothetical protein